MAKNTLRVIHAVYHKCSRLDDASRSKQVRVITPLLCKHTHACSGHACRAPTHACGERTDRACACVRFCPHWSNHACAPTSHAHRSCTHHMHIRARGPSSHPCIRPHRHSAQNHNTHSHSHTRAQTHMHSLEQIMRTPALQSSYTIGSSA